MVKKHTLWIVGLMHGNQLMADEILAWCQSCRDCNCPFECVGDLVASPFARVLGSADESSMSDFELQDQKISFRFPKHVVHMIERRMLHTQTFPAPSQLLHPALGHLAMYTRTDAGL